jgi:hypothetical protein
VIYHSGQEAEPVVGVARRSTRRGITATGDGSAGQAAGLGASNAVQQFCPLAEGGWHSTFCLQELTMAELVAAAGELRQGQGDEGNPRAGACVSIYPVLTSYLVVFFHPPSPPSLYHK